jgi:rhodanese-related sulfurtransferase
MKHSPGFLKLVNAARKRIREMSVDEVKRKLRRREKFLFIDVREEHEWDAGHAAGAMYLGKGIIERDIERLVPDKKTEIVLYCGGGYRSALAADNLRRMGYRNVFSMAGGWRAWKRARGAIRR